MTDLADACRAAGGLVCGLAHPLNGPFVLPLCGRCTGIWVGLGAALLLSWIAAWARGRTVFCRVGLRDAALGAALVLVTVVHAFAAPGASDLGRLAAGAVGGAGAAVLLGRPAGLSLCAAAAVVLLGATRATWAHALLFVASPLAVAGGVAAAVHRIFSVHE